MSENFNQLDFAVLGVQKSATTWIYDCLKDHPQLNMRNSKNEDSYYGGKLYLANGGDSWYFNQFKQKANGGLKGCISVEYIEDKNSAETLFRHNPEIRLIVSLRNPTDRAISAYQWYVRKALIPDLPIEQGIKEAIKKYKYDAANSTTSKYGNIIERGFYAKKLQPFMNKFSKEQINIILFESVKTNSLQIIQSIMSFLKVDSGFIPPNINTIPKKNIGFVPLIKLQRQFPKFKAVNKIVDVSNQLLFKKNPERNYSVKVDQEIIYELNKLYKPSLDALETILEKINPSLKNTMREYWSKTK